jgi:3-isopropylmalate/(R)-2-methylmalate dehydratase small subunit
MTEDGKPGQMKPMRGTAWVFRGVLDVDWEICAYRTYQELQTKGMYTAEEIGKYCMVKVDPDFPKKVRKGDFIVGEFMGFGHDHDHACLSILGAGVAAVLCDTSAPYFFRNSIERGLPVVELVGILDAVKQGDELEVDLENGRLTNISSGIELKFEPMPPFIIKKLAAGGMLPLLKTEVDAGRIPKRIK